MLCRAVAHACALLCRRLCTCLLRMSDEDAVLRSNAVKRAQVPKPAVRCMGRHCEGFDHYTMTP